MTPPTRSGIGKEFASELPNNFLKNSFRNLKELSPRFLRRSLTFNTWSLMELNFCCESYTPTHRLFCYFSCSSTRSSFFVLVRNSPTENCKMFPDPCTFRVVDCLHGFLSHHWSRTAGAKLDDLSADSPCVQHCSGHVRTIFCLHFSSQEVLHR